MKQLKRRPNTRVQRTRSSPSALREPLTRRPLGRLFAFLALVLLATGCVLPSDAARNRELYRALNPTGGLVVFSAGSAERLSRSDSFAVVVQDFGGDSARIEKALVKRIRGNFPQWQHNTDRGAAGVVIEWTSGFSICLDCESQQPLPQWARVQVEVHHGLARAEWTDISHSRSRTRLVNLFIRALAQARSAQAA